MADGTAPKTLGAQAARQLTNTTKTPQWGANTPRWLVSAFAQGERSADRPGGVL